MSAFEPLGSCFKNIGKKKNFFELVQVDFSWRPFCIPDCNELIYNILERRNRKHSQHAKSWAHNEWSRINALQFYVYIIVNGWWGTIIDFSPIYCPQSCLCKIDIYIDIASFSMCLFSIYVDRVWGPSKTLYTVNSACNDTQGTLEIVSLHLDNRYKRVK